MEGEKIHATIKYSVSHVLSLCTLAMVSLVLQV